MRVWSADSSSEKANVATATCRNTAITAGNRAASVVSMREEEYGKTVKIPLEPGTVSRR